MTPLPDLHYQSGLSNKRRSSCLVVFLGEKKGPIVFGQETLANHVDQHGLQATVNGVLQFFSW